MPLASVTIEPWLGGRFENTMVDEDGAEYRMSCTFLDAVEPERFTFCEPASGIVSTTFLTELGPDRTRVVVRQVNVSELYRSPEALEGFEASFDRLAAHLAALVAAGVAAASARRLASPRWPAGARAPPGTAGWGC